MNMIFRLVTFLLVLCLPFLSACEDTKDTSNDSEVAAVSSAKNEDSSAPTALSLTINNNDEYTESIDVNLAVSANDNAEVIAYFVSEDGNTPTANDSGWRALTASSSVDENISFVLSAENEIGAYTKVVYIWFKDAAGNISDLVTDSIQLNVLDIISPTDTSISIDDNSTYTSSVDVTLSLSAVDEVGVSGYLVSENSSMPQLLDSNWASVAEQGNLNINVLFYLRGESQPGSYTKRVYVWFRDVSGNISSVASDSIILNIVDSTPPSLSTISINSGDDSTINSNVNLSLLASDDFGISAYLVSENPSLPQLSDTRWVTVATQTEISDQISFVLSSESDTGNYTKTVYVWFRDETGNISTKASDSIIYTVTDASAPAAGSLAINSGSSTTTGTDVSISLDASDNYGITAYYLSETGSTPTVNDAGWQSVTATSSYQRTVSYSLGASNGTKTVYAWFRDAAANISDVISDSIILDTSTPSNAAQLGTDWMFFGDSQTAGRANESSAKSHAIAFRNIWNTTYNDSIGIFVNGVGGRTLPATYSKYLSTSTRSSASWVHFQESGCQFANEDTVSEFLNAFENFARSIAQETPDAVISTETAYSFEAENEACRDWRNYNTQMRARIASLANNGIKIYLAEVDRNIKELVSRKRNQLGTAQGQQAVWGDAPSVNIGRHYTGLGNLMVALSIYDAMGVDVTSLDFSAIPNSDVSSADKQLCLDIINFYN